MKDRVIFRRWRAEPRTVIAFLPDQDANPGRVVAYEHIGQHGESDYHLCVRATRPCSKGQYDELDKELTRIGYDLKVYQRLNR